MAKNVRVVVMREGRRVVRFRRRPGAKPLPAELPVPVTLIEHVVTSRVRRLRADLRDGFRRMRAAGQRHRLRVLARRVHRATWWWQQVRRATWLPAWLLNNVVERVRGCELALRDVLLRPLHEWCWRQKCLADLRHRRARQEMKGAAS